mmetsp:Transcript_65171/g.201740  ORF Transcript_65171/g.201740 Transcript_65171/m.201740 type:complete len:220 (+) Transcript_65171:69-728(+)
MDLFMRVVCPGSLGTLARLCVGDAAEELEVPGATIVSYPVVTPDEASPQQRPSPGGRSPASESGTLPGLAHPPKLPPVHGLLTLPTPARAAPQQAPRRPLADGEPAEVEAHAVVIFSSETGIAEATEGAWAARLCPPDAPAEFEEPPSPLHVSLLFRAHLAREGQHVYSWRGGRRMLVNAACILVDRSPSCGAHPAPEPGRDDVLCELPRPHGHLLREL